VSRGPRGTLDEDSYAPGPWAWQSCAPTVPDTRSLRSGARGHVGRRNYQRNYQDVAMVLISRQSERVRTAVASRPL